MDLVKLVRPKWWFSAHLHCRFEVVVDHTKPPPAAIPSSLATSNGTGPRGRSWIANGRMERADGAMEGGVKVNGTGMDVVEEKKVVEENPDEIAIDEDDVLEEGIPTPTLAEVQVCDQRSDASVLISRCYSSATAMLTVQKRRRTQMRLV